MLKSLLTASTKHIKFNVNWKRRISTVVIPPSKYDEAQNILRQCYHEEILTKILDLKESDYNAQYRSDREILKEGLSIMMVEPSKDKIIAVILAGFFRCSEDISEEFIYKNDSPFNKLNSIIKLAYQIADISAILKGNTAYEYKMFAVTPHYRKSGITKTGVLLSLELATKYNISTHLATTTSEYTTKLAKNMGFEVIKSISYSYFQDEDGNQLIKNIPSTYPQIDVIKRNKMK